MRVTLMKLNDVSVRYINLTDTLRLDRQFIDRNRNPIPKHWIYFIVLKNNEYVGDFTYISNRWVFCNPYDQGDINLSPFIKTDSPKIAIEYMKEIL